MSQTVVMERAATLACPACRGRLLDCAEGPACDECGRSFPRVAGLVDLRLESDRYLDLDAERAKAERLHALEPETDLSGLAAAYYAITDDVLDARRDRFLRHIDGAERRGETLAARLPRTGRILEVGCGTGGLLAPVLRSGRAVSIEGVDIASRWLVVARRRLTDRGLRGTLVAASVERLPYADDQFDAVVADSLLEHLDDPLQALRECRRVLRPGGRLLLWSPNRYTLGTDPHVGLRGVGWLPRAWTVGYLRLRGKAVWPPRTLSAFEAGRLARQAGLQQVEVDVPEVSEAWAQSLPARQRRAIRVYNAVRRRPIARGLLRLMGPLWELSAVKRGEGA